MAHAALVTQFLIDFQALLVELRASSYSPVAWASMPNWCSELDTPLLSPSSCIDFQALLVELVGPRQLVAHFLGMDAEVMNPNGLFSLIPKHIGRFNGLMQTNPIFIPVASGIQKAI